MVQQEAQHLYLHVPLPHHLPLLPPPPLPLPLPDHIKELMEKGVQYIDYYNLTLEEELGSVSSKHLNQLNNDCYNPPPPPSFSFSFSFSLPASLSFSFSLSTSLPVYKRVISVLYGVAIGETKR